MSGSVFTFLLGFVGVVWFDVPTVLLQSHKGAPKATIHITTPVVQILDREAYINAPPVRVTLSCLVPNVKAAKSPCAIVLRRSAIYGSQRLREAPMASAQDTTFGKAETWQQFTLRVDYQAGNAQTSYDVSEGRYTYTIKDVSCLNAGLYHCALCTIINNATVFIRDYKNLSVIVAPGRITKGNTPSRIVALTRDPVNLTCSGSVGTLGDNEKTAWVWEFRPDSLTAGAEGQWQSVRNTSRATIRVSTDRVERDCITVQTTVLTLTPAPGDRSGNYRCSVEQNKKTVHDYAQIFRVQVSFSTMTTTIRTVAGTDEGGAVPPPALPGPSSVPGTQDTGSSGTSGPSGPTGPKGFDNVTFQSDGGGVDSEASRKKPIIITVILAVAAFVVILATVVAYVICRSRSKAKAKAKRSTSQPGRNAPASHAKVDSTGSRRSPQRRSPKAETIFINIPPGSLGNTQGNIRVRVLPGPSVPGQIYPTSHLDRYGNDEEDFDTQSNASDDRESMVSSDDDETSVDVGDDDDRY